MRASPDRLARGTAAGLIEKFVLGRISFDELEQKWPQTSDRALYEVGERLWGTFYSDVSTVIANSNRPLSAEESALMDKCVAFLSTDLPYEWPDTPANKFVNRVRSIFAGLEKKKSESMIDNTVEGDPGAWPFVRFADLHAAQHERRGSTSI